MDVQDLQLQRHRLYFGALWPRHVCCMLRKPEKQLLSLDILPLLPQAGHHTEVLQQLMNLLTSECLNCSFLCWSTIGQSFLVLAWYTHQLVYSDKSSLFEIKSKNFSLNDAAKALDVLNICIGLLLSTHRRQIRNLDRQSYFK